jgi:hypothetical protein
MAPAPPAAGSLALHAACSNDSESAPHTARVTEVLSEDISREGSRVENQVQG